LQGIGAGFIPDTLDTSVLDSVIKIEQEEAYTFARRLAREEGILGGISTGASLAAVARKISELKEPKRILTFNYDTGERYLSIEKLF
jgi:cysteine synthase A